MKKLTVLILACVFILVFVFGLMASAERRLPTGTEYDSFMPTLQLWLGTNWEKYKKYEEGGIAQRIIKVDFCCIDNEGKGDIYIVDVQFHAKYYAHKTIVEEKDMSQRVLFKVADGRIVDFDPMPAYRLEEIT